MDFKRHEERSTSSSGHPAPEHDRPRGHRAAGPVRRTAAPTAPALAPSTSIVPFGSGAPAGRIRRSSTDTIVRRDDDVAAAIRARRGQATGKSAEDVRKEQLESQLRANLRHARHEHEARAVESHLRAGLRQRRAAARGEDLATVAKETATAEFAASAGARATAEADRVQAPGFAHQLEIGKNATRKARLGELTTEQMIAGARAGHAHHDVGTTVRDEYVRSRDEHRRGVADALAEVGAVNEHRNTRHALMDEALKKAAQAQKQALAMASWDKDELGKLLLAALRSVAAIAELRPKTTDEVDVAVSEAQPKVAALAERAAQDIDLMEILLPKTEAQLDAAQQEFRSTGQTAQFNTSMDRLWSSLKDDGAKADRRADLGFGTTRAALLTSTAKHLAQEIDRKTPFDAAAAHQRFKAGSKQNRENVVKRLFAKVTTKQEIKSIIDAEPNADVLAPIVGKFDALDGLAHILTHTPDRTQLGAIADKARNKLPMLRRVYRGAGDDPQKVRFWLCQAAYDLGRLDEVLTHNGRVWSNETGGAPNFAPPGTTAQQIEAVAVPMAGASRPAPGGYAGNRPYGNQGGPPDMLLPTHTQSGAAISYLEYDIRPYQPGVNRGPQRFVKGSDGRYYRTDDHYASFTRFA